MVSLVSPVSSDFTTAQYEYWRFRVLCKQNRSKRSQTDWNLSSKLYWFLNARNKSFSIFRIIKKRLFSIILKLGEIWLTIREDFSILSVFYFALNFSNEFEANYVCRFRFSQFSTWHRVKLRFRQKTFWNSVDSDFSVEKQNASPSLCCSEAGEVGEAGEANHCTTWTNVSNADPYDSLWKLRFCR